MTRYDHVIIGNSAAGVGALEALQAEGETSICLISEESTPAYSRPFIGHLIDNTRSLDQMWYRPEESYVVHGLDFLPGRKAESLDLRTRRVALDGGDAVGFRNLLLATGGTPIVPPIPGLAESSSTFMTLKDAARIKERLDSGEISSAVILGGGLIGATAASALAKRNVHITIVELAPRILSSVLDEEASSKIQSLLDDRGIETITGHTIKSVKGPPERPESLLDNGRQFASDILIVAIGVRPRVDLARETGIAIDRGIVVNERMETNISGIYAAGDCTQVYDSVRDRSMVLALWPTAYTGGRTAGKNMAGGSAELEWSTSMNSMDFFGTPILSAGIVEAPAEGGWGEISDGDGSTYRKIVFHDGMIKGFVLVGEVDRAGLYLQLMKSRTDLRKLHGEPLSDDFGLAHMPARQRWRMLKEVPGHA